MAQTCPMGVPRQMYITGLVSRASLALVSTLLYFEDSHDNMQALQLSRRLPHQIQSMRIPVEMADQRPHDTDALPCRSRPSSHTLTVSRRAMCTASSKVLPLPIASRMYQALHEW